MNFTISSIVGSLFLSSTLLAPYHPVSFSTSCSFIKVLSERAECYARQGRPAPTPEDVIGDPDWKSDPENKEDSSDSGSSSRTKKASKPKTKRHFPTPVFKTRFVAMCPHPDDPLEEIECHLFPKAEAPGPVKIVVQPIDDSGPPRPVTIEEFKEFPVAKGEIVLQPDQGHHTVNMPVVAATTARQHVVSAEILGYPFHVRFTPISHTFNYGDATTPMTTSDPNTLYPNNRFWHEWSRTGTFTISITTTWSGAYQVAGSAWINVDGTLNTTVSSEPQQVNEYHILLKHPDTPDGPGTPGTPGNPGNLGMPDHQPGTPGMPDHQPGTPGDTITPPDPKRKHSPLQP